MKLPIPLFDKKEKVEYFLALLLRDDRVKVIIFEEIAKKIKVIGSHTEHFTTSLEEGPFEEWLEVFDKSIGTAESMLPPSVNLQKTVFGVKESWVEDSKIKKDYLTKLKKVCEELDLHPIGFLVFTEAISHLLQKEEGAPVSAILVEAGRQTATITILRAGRLLETRRATIDTSLVHTVDSLLKDITSMEVLPSRIILFDGDHVQEVAQKFTSHQWSKGLPFLHMPQITTLPADFDSKAVLFGTASQLGLDLSDTEIPPSLPIKSPVSEVSLAEEVSTKETLHNPEETEEISIEKKSLLPHKDFGFIKNADIAKKPDEIVEKEEPIPSHMESKREFEEESEKSIEEVMDPMRQETQQNENEVEQIVKSQPKRSILKSIPFSFAFLKLPKRQRSPGAMRRSNPIKKFIILAGIILLFIIGICAWYMYTVKAAVTLIINGKSIDQSENVTFSTQNNTDFSKNIIQGKETTITENGDDTAQVTGKKEVGTPAKGTITIFNNNDTSKTLPAGTTLTSSNGLKFTLDKNVIVASASGDIFSGTKPGTTDAGITAADIGPDYNLPSDTRFAVGSSSTVAAKNASAFSGGTKKNVTVVSKDDMDKLLADLTKNLESKAKNDLQKNAPAGYTVLPIIVNTDTQQKNFDKKSGDQASSLTLHGTIVYTGMAYDPNQITDFGKHLFQDKVSQNMILSSKGISYDVTNPSVKDNKTITATVNLHAATLPVIDTASLPHTIAGKSFTEAKNILMQQSQVSDVHIALSPNIFFLPSLLPRMDKHITVTVQTNE